jgi:hypothetical protein
MKMLKPDLVIAVQSIDVAIDPETKTLGLQFVDGSRKRVLLTLSGKELHAFWLGIGRTLNENPYVKHWAQASGNPREPR